MQAVILAAGRGSRLHPATATTSKAMLPVLGKPIVERIMEDIASCGLRHFILVVHPEDEQIQEYSKEKLRLNLDVKLVYQSERLGMAHALLQAAPLIHGDFVLSACDNLVSRLELQRFVSSWREKPGLTGLLALIKVQEKEIERTGIVTLQGDRVTSIIEKPHLKNAPTNIASMPLYCFSERVLEFLSKVKLSSHGEYEIQNAIQMLIDEGSDVRGHQFEKRFTLTTVADLEEINRNIFELHGKHE